MSPARLSCVQRARTLRRALVVSTAVLALAMVALCLGSWRIVEGTSAYVHDLDDAPRRPVALVLGAHVRRGGPSNMLEDRLQAALTLYESGRCDKVLLSGAHDRPDYDEVGVMRQWMEARGVPADDLFLDHAGLRTFDSMVRAKEVFGVSSVVVVSQRYHVSRAVYIGRAIGLDVVGVAAPPGYRYSRGLRHRNEARERVARVAALLDVHVLGTRPRHLGEPIDISGSGQLTH